ncbi:2,3-dihydroxybenzoate-AMP ligase [Mycobacteroides salmoniphilum]|uniref:2,3-dihydroxybenzoate-AMP ligase n=1 Tax=Mycobacteroides salmoniphilum TaxID=404941 RepID=A0A4R8S1R4_9MYCO|nr:AMP-binding protein [Mycobacteroides salmoniphilum]TDZ79955.1 2,3-dihydroxybenzoate-AMP ligase [Mycobacteroides salmoniphilum]
MSQATSTPTASATKSPADGFVPFPPPRADAYRTAGYWTGKTVESLLRTASTGRADHPAVVDEYGAMTYRELDAAADRAAHALVRLGIAPGDRVLLQLPNRASFAVAFFGLMRAGAIPIMCLPGHRGAELSHFIDVSGAVALVIADSAGGFDYRALAVELSTKHACLRHIVIDGEVPSGDAERFTAWSSLLETVEVQGSLPAAQTDTPALLLVSGGTTAAPKLIPRTHEDYVYNATRAAQVCALTEDDVYLIALPAGHNFPLACPGLLGAISVGATTVFLSDPSPESAFETIARHRVSVTALVPSLAQLWAQATAWEPVLPESLRLLQVGGAKLGAEGARTVRESLTPGLQQVFGMAEGLLCLTRPGDPAEILDNTQGRPMCDADEVRIVDEDGAEVAAGEAGELLVRGPYTLNGYYRAEADNVRSFTADGFYRSGDRVRALPDGYLEVTGRTKDVILRGGESIAALDLESHLQTHPAVYAAAAIGLPDQYLGEIVCAAIVFNGKPVTAAELNQHLQDRGAATHSRVDRLVAVPALPLTAVGKIDKRALAASLTS